MDVPFQVETKLEQRIAADAEWEEGAAWGSPRRGHPEGAVAAHIAEVLHNIDRLSDDQQQRERLRLVALVHDTFKHRVDPSKPRSGANHHAAIARTFAKRYIDDDELLDVIELHDEAYNSWGRGDRSGDWGAAEGRARRLIERLGDTLPFYVRFYQVDNETGTKSQEPVEWFERQVEAIRRHPRA